MSCHHFPCFPFAMCCSESWPYSRPDLLDRKFLPHFVMFPLSHGSENHHWSLGGELTVITLSSLQASFIWERGKVRCKGCVAESQALGGPWGHHEGIDAICLSSAPVSHAVFCLAHCPWGSYGNLQRGLSTSPPAFGCYHYFLIPAVPPEAFIALSFPGGASGKEPVCQCRRFKRCGFDPGVWKIPWRRKWQSSPIFLPGESHGQKSLMSYSPWGHTVKHNEVT